MLLSSLLNQDIVDDFEITRVVDDSRLVEPGDVFIFDARIMPEKADEFIAMAQGKGAKAIISNALGKKGIIEHHTPGLLLAKWATYLYPKMPKHLVAVTGTNGKTSVSWFYMQLATGVSKKAASIGTLGVAKGVDDVEETGYTSPTALKLHPVLEQLAKDGVEYVCMEASSHALELHRVDGCRFEGTAITNITQDHLDFHQTMEAYAAAKARLFGDLLDENGTAVVNIQRPELWPVAALVKQRDVNLLAVGSANAELTVDIVEQLPDGLRLRVKCNGVDTTVDVPVVGTFQAQNIATALGLGLASGLDLGEMLKVLPKLQNVPGRMQIVPSSTAQPTVVVDYAHTSDALEGALKALKPLCKGKLWVVFGYGGDRDAGKRPLMGAVAEKIADEIIVTDDNPRTEDPAPIRQQILAACSKGIEMPNRAQAIAHAIKNAALDDIVLIAGKGHETGQIIGKDKKPFSDVEEAQKALKEKAA